MRLSVCVALAAVLLSCSQRRNRTDAPLVPPLHGAPSESEFIDLQPGWRLRVITPVLKSGGYLPQIEISTAADRTITARASDDLVGYETSYYAVRAREGDGVRIEFISAEVTAKGETTPRLQPIVRLFALRDAARLVRLVYLTRVSPADHDMAVIAAGESGELEADAHDVKTDKSACRDTARSICFWIPNGIAVRPEVPAGGAWKPAQ